MVDDATLRRAFGDGVIRNLRERAADVEAQSEPEH